MSMNNSQWDTLETHVVAGVAAAGTLLTAIDPGHTLPRNAQMIVAGIFAIGAVVVEVWNEVKKGHLAEAITTVQAAVPQVEGLAAAIQKDVKYFKVETTTVPVVTEVKPAAAPASAPASTA